MQLSEKTKNKIYLTFSIIFVIISICIIAWIDRQEVDKKISEQAKLICGQKDAEQKNNSGVQEISNNKINDPNAQINTKNEAEASLRNVDNLINSVGVDNSATQ
ncbi:MAG: hypothetical protein WAV31_06600 [Candidatus Moraniibacteriota bacterium]